MNHKTIAEYQYNGDGTCLHPGCNTPFNKVRGRGYCTPHRHHANTRATLLTLPPPPTQDTHVFDKYEYNKVRTRSRIDLGNLRNFLYSEIQTLGSDYDDVLPSEIVRVVGEELAEVRLDTSRGGAGAQGYFTIPREYWYCRKVQGSSRLRRVTQCCGPYEFAEWIVNHFFPATEALERKGVLHEGEDLGEVLIEQAVALALGPTPELEKNQMVRLDFPSKMLPWCDAEIWQRQCTQDDSRLRGGLYMLPAGETVPLEIRKDLGLARSRKNAVANWGDLVIILDHLYKGVNGTGPIIKRGDEKSNDIFLQLYGDRFREIEANVRLLETLRTKKNAYNERDREGQNELVVDILKEIEASDPPLRMLVETADSKRGNLEFRQVDDHSRLVMVHTLLAELGGVRKKSKDMAHEDKVLEVANMLSTCHLSNAQHQPGGEGNSPLEQARQRSRSIQQDIIAKHTECGSLEDGVTKVMNDIFPREIKGGQKKSSGGGDRDEERRVNDTVLSHLNEFDEDDSDSEGYLDTLDQDKNE